MWAGKRNTITLPPSKLNTGNPSAKQAPRTGSLGASSMLYNSILLARARPQIIHLAFKTDQPTDQATKALASILKHTL